MKRELLQGVRLHGELCLEEGDVISDLHQFMGSSQSFGHMVKEVEGIGLEFPIRRFGEELSE